MDISMVEILFIAQTGAPAAAGDGAALVVQEPLPRLARTAALPGMHEIVRRAA